MTPLDVPLVQKNSGNREETGDLDPSHGWMNPPNLFFCQNVMIISMLWFPLETICVAGKSVSPQQVFSYSDIPMKVSTLALRVEDKSDDEPF